VHLVHGFTSPAGDRDSSPKVMTPRMRRTCPVK
jgi:hypothetical protein